MKKQSKLVRWEKRIYKDVHSNYQGNWDFNVQFENGDELITKKKSPDATFQIGELYHYEYVEKQMTPNWLKKSAIGMKTEAELEKGKEYASGKTTPRQGGYKMTPEKQKAIMCQVSMISSNTIMNKLSEDYDEIVRQFLSYLILNAPNHDPISLQGALKIAAEYWNQVPVETVSIEQILQTTTDNIIKTEKSGKWDGTLKKSMKESLPEQSLQDDRPLENPPLEQPPEESQDPFLRIV